MNFGTKLRTILRIAASLQNAAVVMTASIAAFSEQYHIGWLVFVWAIFTLVCNFVVDAITTYYNNDYSEEGEVGTNMTRELKLINEFGEDFEVPDVEEPEDAGEVLEDE